MGHSWTRSPSTAWFQALLPGAGLSESQIVWQRSGLSCQVDLRMRCLNRDTVGTLAAVGGFDSWDRDGYERGRRVSGVPLQGYCRVISS